MKNRKLRIEKVLTLSTCHISEETARQLEKSLNGEYFPISVYRKERYGWWLFIQKDRLDEFAVSKYISDDLYECIQLAVGYGCEWLCLDCDGQEADNLQRYEW